MYCTISHIWHAVCTVSWYGMHYCVRARYNQLTTVVARRRVRHGIMVCKDGILHAVARYALCKWRCVVATVARLNGIRATTVCTARPARYSRYSWCDMWRTTSTGIACATMWWGILLYWWEQRAQLIRSGGAREGNSSASGRRRGNPASSPASKLINWDLLRRLRVILEVYTWMGDTMNEGTR